MSCEDIPSLLDLQNTKKHVDDFGRLMGTGTGTSTNGVTGQVRPTYNAVMSNLGYTRVGTFASGATLLNGRQTLLWDVADGGDGQEYGWSGVFLPSGKIVPPGSTPHTTGGIAVGAWMSRFDPELQIIVFEALLRSYAEAGYSLIGRFGTTGLVVNAATDVVLWEPTGVAYSYSGTLPHTIGAGETPIGNPNWVDRSGAVTISEKVGYKERTVASRLDDTRHLKDFWMAVDLDWTNAFERASQASKDGGFVVQCPQGELAISDSVTLYTATPPNWGEFYKAKGSRFIGHPRGTTIKKSVVGTKPVNAAVYLQGGRGLQWTGIDIIDESAGSYGVYGSIDVSFSEFKNLFISTNEWGMYFNTAIYVAVDIANIVFSAYPPGGRHMKNGIRIPAGSTSYTLKNIACFTLFEKAYVLSGSYCEIGPLACDDCAGVPYTFSNLDASISGLGVENISAPSSGTVIDVTASSSINIDVLSLHGVVQPANTSLINYNAFGRIRVGSIRGGGGTTLNGRLANVSTNGAVEVSYINVTAAQNNIGPVNVGNVAGAQYVQRYGSSVEFKYIRMPEASQNDATVRYRIMGRFNGDVGCLGTISEARAGSGVFPRSAMYDINCIGSGSTQYAIRVKQAVSESSSNNYNAWFTATYKGVSYVLCQLDTAGTRTLGSYFNGIVYGLDSNLFAVVTAADVTSLASFAGGVIKTETAS